MKAADPICIVGRDEGGKSVHNEEAGAELAGERAVSEARR